MSSIVQNDTSSIIAYLVLASDHVTPATGKTLTITISKNGGDFAAFGGTSSELSGGFYKLTPVTADVGTLGDLAISVTAASCDDWTDVRRVVQAGAAASDWTSTRAGKIDSIDAKTTNLPTDPADQSLLIAATDAIMTAIGNIASGSGLDAAGVRAAIGLAAANLDTQIAALPTAVENADALLARNQKGGADGPAEESVSAALAGGFIDFAISGATLTVNNGDGTPAFTRTLTRDQTLALGAILGAS